MRDVSWVCEECGHTVDTPAHELGCPLGRGEVEPSPVRYYHYRDVKRLITLALICWKVDKGPGTPMTMSDMNDWVIKFLREEARGR